MAKVIPNRVFEDYDPPSDLVTEEACDTLLIYLPGFKKEQLKVQLTISRMLKITGERPLGDNKYRRFHKEFRIPSNCDTKEISAKFEGGILYIRQPKISTPVAPPPPPPAPVQPQKSPAEAPRTQQLPHPPPYVPAPLPTPPPPSPQQQLAPPTPPTPHLQSQQQAPLPPPPLSPPSPPQSQSHFQQAYPEEDGQEEPRTEEKGQEEMGSNVEESRDESGVVQGPRQVIGTLGTGIFRELNKPDNLKRLGVSVLLVLIIAFYISYMFKSFMGNEQDAGSEYYEEL